MCDDEHLDLRYRSPPYPDYHHQSMLSSADRGQVYGALIELVGATICIVGLNLQRWAALWLEKNEQAEGFLIRFGGWRWLFAISVFLTGQIVQTVAYAYGTQTLVSAVSNVSLVVNVVIAHAFFGEHFSVWPQHDFGPRWLIGWDLGAMVILLGGSVVTAIFAPVGAKETYNLASLRDLFEEPIFVGFLCVVLALTGVCVWQAYWVVPQLDASRQASWGGLMFATAAAALGSISITLSKVSVLLLKTTLSGSNQFRQVSAWIFVVAFIGAAILNLRVLNQGLAKFEAMLIIPIYYVVSTLLTMLSGELLYQTYELFTRAEFAYFAVGVACSLAGVYLLAHHDEMPGEGEVEDAKDGEGMGSPDAPPAPAVLPVTVSDAPTMAGSVATVLKAKRRLSMVRTARRGSVVRDRVGALAPVDNPYPARAHRTASMDFTGMMFVPPNRRKESDASLPEQTENTPLRPDAEGDEECAMARYGASLGSGSVQ